jgi:hypothetical protein
MVAKQPRRDRARKIVGIGRGRRVLVPQRVAHSEQEVLKQKVAVDETLGALDPTSNAYGGERPKSHGATLKAHLKERTRPLNFRVTPKYRRAFKEAAVTLNCKKVELLERIFEEWTSRESA